jgi:succinoglycan biosynthesis protein ExoM
VLESVSREALGVRPSGTRMTVDVCVCTYHRPAIAETLRSISVQQGCGEVKLRLIVADNAADIGARESILSTARELGLDLVYVHAPSNNISIARNACLDSANAEWIAFLDDDEIASPQWLDALLAEARRGSWDAVLGPVRALYSPSAPVWLRTGDFHSQRPVYVRGRIETGYTGNVLIRRSLIERDSMRFKVELGRSGGEDVDFFYRISDAGGRIGFAPDAVAYSSVTADRANFAWILKRNFRAGQTHGSRLDARVEGVVSRSQAVVVALAKASVYAVAAAAHLPQAARRSRYLARAVLHCGVAARLVGFREIKCY